MMETFRTYCSIDAYGRLNVLSSTQIVFHCRRILANALHSPKSMIRVAKPRIGGGFGAKQTSVCEVYPAFVTWKTSLIRCFAHSRQMAAPPMFPTFPKSLPKQPHWTQPCWKSNSKSKKPYVNTRTRPFLPNKIKS
mgnify:CR=1 FL=1